MLNIEANLNSIVEGELNEYGFNMIHKYADSCIEELENNGMLENELEILRDKIIRVYITETSDSRYMFTGSVLNLMIIFGGIMNGESPFVDDKFIIKIDTDDSPNITLDR